MTGIDLTARLARIRRDFPAQWAALEGQRAALPAPLWHCLSQVYAVLDDRDLICLPMQLLANHARACLETRQTLPFAAQVPEELSLAYLLPPRVNNEFPDGSRPFLLEQLRPVVAGLEALPAALEVNWWCCAQAGYRPTDQRTIAPLGMLRRGQGRCGEESTLLVSALRAVGIPARQVYAPWWAHCDDNHAWVEFWADGEWHYTGACEPEPAADTGWFTSAASRAMLIRAFAPDFQREAGHRLVNVTGRYGDTVFLTVLVSRDGHPCPGAEVAFQLVNDSHLRTLHRQAADAHGQVTLEVGRGCLAACAVWDGRLIQSLVDTRHTTQVELRWEEGYDPLRQAGHAQWELTPPSERVPPVPPEDTAHQARLAGVEARRAARLAVWDQEEDALLRRARGNREEIARFLALPHFSREDKQLLLSTLTEKDLADVTANTLASFLSAALPHKGRFPLEVWRDQILAPRAEWEPLLPIRPELAARLAGEGLDSPRAVLAWMDRHLRPLEEYGRTDRRGDAAAYLRHGVCPPSERQGMAVQLCRALGIPARLDPTTGCILSEDNSFSDSIFTLILRPDESGLRQWEHFTLERWTGICYEPLSLPLEELGGPTSLSLPAGAYRLTTARRQVDGSVSARLEWFFLQADRVQRVSLASDQTACKLTRISLPLSDPAETQGGGLLLFLQPGAEPTEHLLQELLELQGPFRQGDWPVRLLAGRREELDNPTLCQVLAALPAARAGVYRREDRFAVQRAMGLGDARLPLAVALDGSGRGLYAAANYQIRLAHRLLAILQL